MDTSSYICSKCSRSYDLGDHIPLRLPSCSHVFCRSCVDSLAKSKSYLLVECPIDKIFHTLKTKSIKDIPHDPVLIQSLLLRHKSNISISKENSECLTHSDTPNKLCVECSSLFCPECPKNESHADHKCIEDFFSKIKSSVGDLETSLKRYKFFKEEVEYEISDKIDIKRSKMMREIETTFANFIEELQQLKEKIILQLIMKFKMTTTNLSLKNIKIDSLDLEHSEIWNQNMSESITKWTSLKNVYSALEICEDKYSISQITSEKLSNAKTEVLKKVDTELGLFNLQVASNYKDLLNSLCSYRAELPPPTMKLGGPPPLIKPIQQNNNLQPPGNNLVPPSKPLLQPPPLNSLLATRKW